jgi:cystathionine beta-lyase
MDTSLFDQEIDRRGTHCSKWDRMEALYGVSPSDGLAMWVADMEFRAPDCVQNSLEKMLRHGVYGYFGDDASNRRAICWWMKARHGWEVHPDAIFTTHGLVNGAALCIDIWSRPGDGVVLMTPVYHAFHRIVAAAGREVVQCPMDIRDGRYRLNIAAWGAQMTGREKIFMLCSPHNPGGRVWQREELREIGEFCRRHDLILISDEIHMDLVFPGHTHLPVALAAPEVKDRLVVMTSASKTFNIAGAHTGNVIVEDETLRQAFANRLTAWGISASSFGMQMSTAAYSPEGAAWVDSLMRYVDGNRRLFDEAINSIPGLTSMPLESTYLAWVNFTGTGLEEGEILRRLATDAKIAANHGGSFGKGGEGWMRFNVAMPRRQVEDAARRMQVAFGGARRG